jgi:23S rRNA (cytidine1920-2'-O)/16S rRNA (cytidine1409-2'-O)-methyltransferase
MTTKERLDLLVFERGLAPSREKARAMVMAGEVTVNGHLADKPGTRFPRDVEIVTKTKRRYVSRGGEKLAGGLAAFAFDPRGMICADVGASTGGFTDCLLQHGTARVYAIDVGYGQLDYALRQDSRVIAIERTNARTLETLAEPVDLVVIDASFISLHKLLPTIMRWLRESTNPADGAAADGATTSGSHIIALIKPQFEAGKAEADRGKGVIRDSAIHTRVLHEVATFAQEIGLFVRGLAVSPLKGPEGNTEFLIWLCTRAGQPPFDLHAAIAQIIPA